MNKSSSRLAYLLLIPCLIADPVMARGLGETVGAPSVGRIVAASPVMNAAAFAAIPTWMHLTRLKNAYRFRRMAGGRRAEGAGYSPGTHDPEHLGVDTVLLDRMGWIRSFPNSAFAQAFSNFQTSLKDERIDYSEYDLLGELRNWLFGLPVPENMVDRLTSFTLHCIAASSAIPPQIKPFERPYLEWVQTWLKHAFPQYQQMKLDEVGTGYRLYFTADPGKPWERKIQLELIHSVNHRISSAQYVPLPSAGVPEYLIQLQLLAAENSHFVMPLLHELRETAWRTRGYSAPASHERAEKGLWPTQADLPDENVRDGSPKAPGASHSGRWTHGQKPLENHGKSAAMTGDQSDGQPIVRSLFIRQLTIGKERLERLEAQLDAVSLADSEKAELIILQIVNILDSLRQLVGGERRLFGTHAGFDQLRRILFDAPPTTSTRVQMQEYLWRFRSGSGQFLDTWHPELVSMHTVQAQEATPASRSDVEVFLKRVGKAIGADQHWIAIALLDEADKIWPNNRFLRMKRVEALRKRGDHAEAVRVAQELDARIPDDPYVLCTLASALIHGDRADEGVRIARDAVARFPLDPVLQSTLAFGLLRLGQAENAVALARDAAKRFPDRVSAWNTLATILADAGLGSEALRIAEETLERYPRRRDVQSTLDKVRRKADEQKRHLGTAT